MEKKANHLLCRHANCLDAELAATEIKKVLQVWTQKIDDEDIVKTLLSKMVNLRNAD